MSMKRRYPLRAILTSLAMALLLAPVFTLPASAAPPGPPPPSLNPPPHPLAVCQTSSAGTICHLDRFGPVAGSGDTSLRCGGDPVIDDFSWTAHAAGYYNASGQMIRDIVHFEQAPGGANTL